MGDVADIQSKLLSSPELRQTIVRQIGSFTVALFALVNSQAGERLKLAGTGTLFETGGSYFILTAAHVWEQVLGSAAKVGVSLEEEINHSYWIDPASVVPFGPERPGTWGEWGPDVILLRIPAVHIGDIKARRVFYDPALDGLAARSLKRDHAEIWLLMGTPEARGQLSRNHAQVEINGRFLQEPRYQTRGSFDYLDAKVETSILGLTDHFGGFSGGGLWKVLLYYSPEGKIDWVQTLEGVAFYQSDIEGSYRTIRSHGPKSIAAAISFM